jgi:hypothetical protein
MLGAADLQREAEATGFRGEALEKVIRLLELLEGFRSHPFLALPGFVWVARHRDSLRSGLVKALRASFASLRPCG